MFQPETEDMLPRAAPKPTTPLDQNEPVVKPTVPEISILFNQPTINGQTKPPPQQSYASWKKQMLPKIIYPPNAADNASAPTISITNPGVSKPNYTEMRCSVYPLRTGSLPSSTALGASAYSHSNCDSVPYHRSVESCPPPTIYSHVQDTRLNSCNNPPCITHLQQQQQQRRSLDTITQHSLPSPTTQKPHEEVLTICAGTQTEILSTVTNMHDQLFGRVVTSQEFQQVMSTLQDMRREQQRLTEICCALLEQQKQPLLVNKQNPKILKDVGTQYDVAAQALTSEQRPTELHKDYITEEPYEVNSPVQYRNKALINVQHNQHGFQSPRVRPAAHSTEYRANTPLAINNQHFPQQQKQQNIVLPKATTDQSMVMNELALKYLPNDKLNELLQDMRLTPTQPLQNNTARDKNYNAIVPPQQTATPLRNIENVDKGPSDISNASYKYLKKYRLLPEEHQNYQQDSPPFAGGQQRARQENILDLEAIRRQPKFI